MKGEQQQKRTNENGGGRQEFMYGVISSPLMNAFAN